MVISHGGAPIGKPDARVPAMGRLGMDSRDKSLAELWDRADKACREARELVDNQGDITKEIKRKITDIIDPKGRRGSPLQPN